MRPPRAGVGLRGVGGQLRAGWALAELLRGPGVDARGWEAALARRLAEREDLFLSLAERFIFARPESPYRPLLEVAGYDSGRLRGLVRSGGLDAALDQLQADGVYVTIQEFKGLRPAVRGSRSFQFRPGDFVNAGSTSVLQAPSSGSRGGGSAHPVSAIEMLDRARTRLWMLQGYGVADRNVVIYGTPGTVYRHSAEYLLIGRRPLRAFALVEPAGIPRGAVFALTRLASGRRLPPIEFAGADRALEVARYIARINTPRGLIVDTPVNSALRLILAAEEAGVRLGDVVFIGGGEALTAFKRTQIESRGFRYVIRFAFAEFGAAGWACASPRLADDIHVTTDQLAVRRHRRPVDPEGTTVDAYLFTSLLPSARSILLNVETGDYGGLEERRCGCFLDRAGFRLHMHTIRSFEKLTAEGITFLGPTIINLIEEILPQAFGGDHRHYQLVEAEDSHGFTRLYILASPVLGPLDEDALRQTVLHEFARSNLQQGYGRLVERVWSRANTVQVLRRDPLATRNGKILHLYRDGGVLPT